MNTLTKKQYTPQRRNDATKRKEPKNKIMYVTTRPYNKLTDIEKILHSQSYKEVIIFGVKVSLYFCILLQNTLSR